MSDLFCRHNRFTADCPICSKGTLLESDATRPRPRAPTPSPRRSGGKPGIPPGAQVRGPYATAGPYDRDGERIEVRLEKVPGGIRLAEWANGAIRRAAPVLPVADLGGLLTQARERHVLPERELEKLETAVAEEATGEPNVWGSSAGRTGDFREELRVEAVDDGAVRIARWILRPGSDWEMQEAPPMLPAARFAEALAAARRAGAA
ncbi:MAG TPA: hypothetical protein VFY37_13210 [Solirubrobacterales bacterium]|nr:hypothetical protein [Solirubrobacterales bacterium]